MSYDLAGEHDSTKAAIRAQVQRDVHQADPDELVVIPPCHQFPRLQNLTPDWKRSAEQRELRRLLLQEALVLLRYAILVASDQVTRGRRALIEHPPGADSWRLPCMQKLLRNLQGVQHCDV